jgi:DNA-binding XRE family transcriptional regulator
MKKVGRKPKGNEKFILKSKLKDFIQHELESRREVGYKVLLDDLYEEIADFSGISAITVYMFRQEKIKPSLAVSMRIAEYFNVKVEEIWLTECNENYVEERGFCSIEGCNYRVSSNNLCLKHYSRYKNNKRINHK